MITNAQIMAIYWEKFAGMLEEAKMKEARVAVAEIEAGIRGDIYGEQVCLSTSPVARIGNSNDVLCVTGSLRCDYCRCRVDNKDKFCDRCGAPL